MCKNIMSINDRTKLIAFGTKTDNKPINEIIAELPELLQRYNIECDSFDILIAANESHSNELDKCHRSIDSRFSHYDRFGKFARIVFNNCKFKVMLTRVVADDLYQIYCIPLGLSGSIDRPITIRVTEE